MRKMQRETGASLRAAAQVSGIAEHFGQRHQSANDLASGAGFRTLNLGATRVQITEYRSHIFIGNNYFDAHDGFKQYRTGPAASFLESNGARNLEGHFRAVHLVVAAIDKNHGNINHFVACENSAVHRFANARFDGRDIFPGNGATDNLVDEKEAVFFVELPATAGAGNLFGER